MVACLEEIAYRMGYITAADLDAAGARDGVERLRPVPAARARAGGLTCASSRPSFPASSSSSPTCIATAAASFSRPITPSGIASTASPDRSCRTTTRGRSAGTLRGLHLQLRRPQGKLVRVIEGEIFDVAVDVRRGSPTFGRWVGVDAVGRELQAVSTSRPASRTASASSARSAQVEYKCTDFYDPASEIGIAWNDPALGDRLAGRPTDPLRARQPVTRRSPTSSTSSRATRQICKIRDEIRRSGAAPSRESVRFSKKTAGHAACP